MNLALLNMFYRMKPLIPRKVQLKMRQVRAQRIFSQLQPPYLEGLDEEKERLIAPEGYSCVVLLTHDVETVVGLKKIELLREIERDFDVPSTWNFVLKKYGDPSRYIDKLRAEGCECGAHGLYHDGKLFKDYDTYRSRMDEIVAISETLGLEGFRAPALHRNKEWMQDLPFKWDSSFPAWDPFQPQPGGCRRYVPFKLNERTWELPVTLWQDFTLFSELRMGNVALWKVQVAALSSSRALINVIVHSDYSSINNRQLYSQFTEYIANNASITVTTPSKLIDCLNEARTTYCSS